MYQSIEQELHQLRDQLGDSPIAAIFAGLHHVRYLVAPGTAWPFIIEWSRKTRYHFKVAYRQLSTGSTHYLLKLKDNPIAIIIEESSQPLSGFPRLQALGFRVQSLEPVRELLQNEQITFSDSGYGLETAPLTGLGDRFWYVTGSETDWFQGPDFEPAAIDPQALEAASVIDPALEVIKGIDHIAYRTRLDQVRTAATMLMRLTAYRFDSCYTVGDQNAETMVFRWGNNKPAMVASYGWDEESVVYKYTSKYGPRVHHLAFYAEQVLGLVAHQQKNNITFTTEQMIGDASRGILQIFSTPSLFSHEICEYIERFGGFRGFFDKGNVGELMNSTKKFN
jgi:hypothetical protein